MHKEYWLYVALLIFVVAFVWAWRVAREKRRRAQLLKRSLRNDAALRASRSGRNGSSQRSEMRGAESKSEVMEQLAKQVKKPAYGTD